MGTDLAGSFSGFLNHPPTLHADCTHFWERPSKAFTQAMTQTSISSFCHYFVIAPLCLVIKFSEIKQLLENIEVNMEIIGFFIIEEGNDHGFLAEKPWYLGGLRAYSKANLPPIARILTTPLLHKLRAYHINALPP